MMYRRAPLSLTLVLALVMSLAVAGPLSAAADDGVTLRGALFAATPSGALTLSVPDDVEAGDLLLATVDIPGRTSVVPDSGWQEVRTDSHGRHLTKATYYRIAGADEPDSYSWEVPGGDPSSGGLMAYSGVDEADPIAADSGDVVPNHSAIVAPSVTTSQAGGSVVALYGAAANAVLTLPGDMSGLGETAISNGTNHSVSVAGDAEQSVAGHTGDKAATADQRVRGAGQLVALRPAPSAEEPEPEPTEEPEPEPTEDPEPEPTEDPEPEPTEDPEPEPTEDPEPEPTEEPEPSPADEYRVPDEIADDGSVDVTDELNAFLATVPDGTEDAPSVINLEEGVFQVEGTLLLRDRHHLHITGGRVEARTAGEDAEPWSDGGHRGWPRLRQHWRIDGGSTHILFTDTQVVGANPHAGTSREAYVSEYEAQHAFAVDGDSAHITIRDVKASDVYGDFVYVRSHDVLVENSEFERNGRQCVAIVRGERITVRDNTIDQCRRAVFDIEPNTSSSEIRDVIIEGNTTGRGRLLWLAMGGRGGDNVSDVVVRDNVMEARTGVPTVRAHGREGDLRGPILIENNTLRVGGSPAPGFRFDHTQGVTMRDNDVIFPAAREMLAVAFYHSDSGLVQNNRFCGAAQILETAGSTNISEDDNVADCE